MGVILESVELNLVEQDILMNHSWPPVARLDSLAGSLGALLALPQAERPEFLRSLRATPPEHARFIQTALSCVYAYWFGYQDSPVYLAADDQLESEILSAKILIEREMLDHWLMPKAPPKILTQRAAGEYLRNYIEDNSGIYHAFFEYVRHDMPREQLIEFLQFEAVRNEVVDDEVALIVVGLQGQMKNAMVSNLWDECGNGSVIRFHTHWLRRLLTSLRGVEAFRVGRSTSIPWFTGITSNSFNMMATRPGYKYRAFGSFLMTESWVNAHFQRILEGMKRVGLDDPNLTVYFSKHCSIDPYHTDQIITALTHQQPKLTEAEITEILWGAHTAVAAGTKLYEESARYFLSDKKTG